MANNDQAYMDSVRSRITDFETCYNKMSRHLEMYSNYTTWLHFECNGLVIDTANPKNKNLILQTWEYNKNGSGYANDFTLRICYNFSEASELYKEPDIHYVEMAIGANKYLQDGEGKLKAFQENSEKLKCKFRYGYINVDSSTPSLLSPEYTGMILKCTPELRDNMLFYTISGRSLIYGGSSNSNNNLSELDKKLKDIKIQFPDVDGTQWRATDLAWDILNKYFGDKRSENKKYVNVVKQEYAIVNKTAALGLREKEKNMTETIKGGSYSVFEYVNKVLSQADVARSYFSDEEIEKMDDSAKPYYTVYIDDVNCVDGKPCIVIDIVDPSNTIYQSYVKNGEEDQLKNYNKYDSSVIFEYPKKDQNFILSFVPDLNLMLLWTQVLFSDSNVERWGITAGGNLIKSDTTDDNGYTTVTIESNQDSAHVDGTSAQDQTDNADKDLDPKETTESRVAAKSFTEAANLCYTASLSCLGIPADIPIMTRIQIIPILNGCKYMFQGTYIVKSCSDRIDSSGYITEMQLMRLQS